MFSIEKSKTGKLVSIAMITGPTRTGASGMRKRRSRSGAIDPKSQKRALTKTHLLAITTVAKLRIHRRDISNPQSRARDVSLFFGFAGGCYEKDTESSTSAQHQASPAVAGQAGAR